MHSERWLVSMEKRYHQQTLHLMQTHYSQQKVIRNQLKSNQFILFAIAAILLLCRGYLCAWMAKDAPTPQEYENIYWTWVYYINMACIAIAIHGICTESKWVNLIIDGFAGFIWQDIIGRIISNEYQFVYGDVLFIIGFVLFLAYKYHVGTKGNK